MRIPLAAADDLLARLETVLLEYAALVELDRPGVGARLALADSLNEVLSLRLLEAQGVGITALAAHAAELRAVALEGRSTALWWFALGGVLFGPLLLLVWRRLGPPLAALEHGLERVARGDLAVRLPMRRADEVGRLTRHFNDMTGVLEKRAAEQGRFIAAGELIAGVAHEVNNPLMAIVAVASNQLDAALPMAAETRDALEQVQQQARRAGKLLGGLLRFVRRAPEAPARLVDPNRVIGDALDLVAFRFPVDQITVRDDRAMPLPRVRAKVDTLEQVLVNLLSNAIHALVERPPPRVLRVSSRHEGDHVVVAVEDSGPGVPPNMQERIFQPFATSKGPGGTGLGLYISRQIAQAAGGDLALEPGTLGGARFVLRLPVADGAAAGAAEAPAPATPGTAVPLAGLSILLVEDEAAVRAPIAAFLRRRGAIVHEAGHGGEGLQAIADLRARAEPLHLVVVDMRMPVLDGPAFYRELRRSDPATASKVLFLSGDISLFTESGDDLPSVDRVMLKPVELPELEARIRQLTG
jgi:signal transduction histidine kinase